MSVVTKREEVVGQQGLPQSVSDECDRKVSRLARTIIIALGIACIVASVASVWLVPLDFVIYWGAREFVAIPVSLLVLPIALSILGIADYCFQPKEACVKEKPQDPPLSPPPGKAPSLFGNRVQEPYSVRGIGGGMVCPPFVCTSTPKRGGDDVLPPDVGGSPRLLPSPLFTDEEFSDI